MDMLCYTMIETLSLLRLYWGYRLSTPEKRENAGL
jgi:hypothetical protein